MGGGNRNYCGPTTHAHLQDACNTLEAHASVHVPRRQRLEAAVILAVELNEHQIPNFEHVWIVYE